MLHDHRAFDRALNPDAAQALEHALEPMIMLQAEQRKPQPRAVDDIRAWHDQIGEYEDQLRRIAERGGVDVADLKTAATRLIAKRSVLAPATPAPPPAERAQRPTMTQTFAALAAEDAEITRELLAKRQQIVAIDREIAALAKRQAALHRRLYRRGRRLGH